MLHTFTKKQFLLVISSAALSAIAFHPVHLHFLAWIGLIPLLFALKETTLSRSFVIGIIFGALFSLFALFWLVFLQIELNIKLLMFFGLILLFLYHGLYYGVALAITKRLGLWIFPLAISGLDFIRGIGEIGFPWLTLGYSQARYPIMIQPASLIGVYGLSLWIAAVNVLIYKVITTRKLVFTLLTVAAIIIPGGYGVISMQQKSDRPVRLGIIQPNINPNLKFTKTMREETFNRLIRLSEQCAADFQAAQGERLDIIVWPETATPVFLTFPGSHQQRVIDLCNRLQIPIFTGTPIYDMVSKDMYNGAVLILPGKGIHQEYRKLHLVPFGEHIPYDQYLSPLRSIDVGGGDYRPGKDHTVFHLDGINFSCLICFESIFPELARTFIKQGAAMFVNITNDGWFGTISGPQQHNDMAILRAVEYNVPLARSSNTGISMLVDAHGRVIEESPLFKETYLYGTVGIMDSRTLYARIGDVIPIGALIIIPLFWVVLIVKRRQ